MAQGAGDGRRSASIARRRLAVAVLTLVVVAGIWGIGVWLKGNVETSSTDADGNASSVTQPSTRPATSEWTFTRGRPIGWKEEPTVRLTPTPNGLDVSTTTGVSDYQLMSDPVVLRRGEYSVRLTAAIRFGGLELGVLDDKADKWLVTAQFASNQGSDTRALVLPFHLGGPRSVRIVLANWMPGSGQSRWRIVDVRMARGFALASQQAQANAAALPATGSASFGGGPPASVSPPANLAKVIPAAVAAMHDPGTTWAKAARIRTLVREAMPPGSTCGEVANAYWLVGSRSGLTIRLVLGMANGTNLYDSHETTSVWLPEERRWVISDATFNGYWSAGRSATPIGVETLRDYLRTGRRDDLYWHQTPSRNAIRPSSYYVDPLRLYEYAGVQASVRGASVFLVWDPAFATFGVYQIPSSTNIDEIPPGTALPVTKVPSRSSTASFSMPPPYLGRRVAEERLVIAENGRGRLRLGHAETVVAVTAAARTGNWVIDQSDGTQFPLTSIGGGELSPIITLGSSSTLRVTGAAPGTYLVHLWAPKLFPKARELGS